MGLQSGRSQAEGQAGRGRGFHAPLGVTGGLPGSAATSPLSFLVFLVMAAGRCLQPSSGREKPGEAGSVQPFATVWTTRFSNAQPVSGQDRAELTGRLGQRRGQTPWEDRGQDVRPAPATAGRPQAQGRVSVLSKSAFRSLRSNRGHHCHHDPQARGAISSKARGHQECTAQPCNLQNRS